MSIEVKVPQLPESVADATLLSWHKAPGDAVERDENLVDLETDKVVLEVPAPVSGVLAEIKVEDGATVTSGELLALLEEGAAPLHLGRAGQATLRADHAHRAAQPARGAGEGGEGPARDEAEERRGHLDRDP